MNAPEIYVSTDVETDVPIPALNSMLSIGSATYDRAGQFILLALVLVAMLGAKIVGAQEDRKAAMKAMPGGRLRDRV